MKCAICEKGSRAALCAECRRGCVEVSDRDGVEAMAVWVVERHRSRTVRRLSRASRKKLATKLATLDGEGDGLRRRVREAFLEAASFVSRIRELQGDTNLRAGAIIGRMLMENGSFDLAPMVLGCSPEEIVERAPPGHQAIMRRLLRPKLSVVKGGNGES